MSRLLLTTGALAALVLTAGCQQGARYEDPNGTRTVTNLDKVNIQDFAKASDTLVQSMLNSAAFAEIAANGKKPVLAISSIRNDTASQFDTDLLIQKINTALIRTGKLEVSTTVAGGGRSTDSLAKELRRQDDFAEGRDSLPKAPEYTLSGKILEDQSRAGSMKQTSYVFQLTLTRVRTGTAIWAEETIVTKQGEKDSVGW